MKLDLWHLKRRCVAVPHQIADQTTILTHLFCALSIGHTGGLNDRFIGAHIIDDTHETVIEYRQRHAQNLIERLDTGTHNFLRFGFFGFLDEFVLRSHGCNLRDSGVCSGNAVHLSTIPPNDSE